ncbi:glyoxalase family protein [Plectosphaerella plurivora]|uniref:Glyoxalase family protein n=1 Tax=Plectosphaerella plurivora TaxID=936078 RepID=A0A9P9AAD7_9PEZI|nr:glyoxalase family protein [Plectosphaerella plurivora]
MAEAMKSAWKVIPGLPSKDIRATASFYADVLHFTVAETKTNHDSASDEPDFCSVFAGPKAAVNIYFTLEKDAEPGWVVIAMGTTQLDEMYEGLVADGRTKITEPIADTEMGWRKFTIADPDDNKLTFFKFLEGGNPGEE